MFLLGRPNGTYFFQSASAKTESLTHLQVEGITTREDRIKTLVKAIKNGSYTDETFGLIEFELLKLISLAKTEEPVKATTTVQEPKEDNKIQEIKQFRNLLNL